MNLNEICLLNFLKNPDEINELSALVSEFCVSDFDVDFIKSDNKIIV